MTVVGKNAVFVRPRINNRVQRPRCDFINRLFLNTSCFDSSCRAFYRDAYPTPPVARINVYSASCTERSFYCNTNFCVGFSLERVGGHRRSIPLFRVLLTIL
jgi:hypothetical protein